MTYLRIPVILGWADSYISSLSLFPWVGLKCPYISCCGSCGGAATIALAQTEFLLHDLQSTSNETTSDMNHAECCAILLARAEKKKKKKWCNALAGGPQPTQVSYLHMGTSVFPFWNWVINLLMGISSVVAFLRLVSCLMKCLRDT